MSSSFAITSALHGASVRRVMQHILMLLLIAPWAQSMAATSESLGATWQSLAALPDLLNAQWIPQNMPASEKAFMRTMSYPPLKPEYAADAKAMIAAILAGDEALPTAHCRRDGMPRMAWYPYPVQFMYGAGVMMRQLGTTAAGNEVLAASSGAHPANLKDPDALLMLNFNGDARFVWAGDTLIIDTIAVRDDIDTFYGVPNDPDIHVVERYKLIDANTLERNTTIDAPNVFTQPWTLRTIYKRGPAQSLALSYCPELPI